MLREVKQRENYDCGIACLSMISGESYEAVKNNLPEHVVTAMPEGGMEVIHVLKFLWKLKFEAKYHIYENGGVWVPNNNWWILSVPSLNYKDKYHFIVWDGEKVLDPSTKLTYTKQLLFELGTDSAVEVTRL